MSLADNILEFPTPEAQPAPSGFVRVPHSILCDATLSAGLRVYWSILDGHASKDGTCFPGEERLASLVGCTARWIRQYNVQLVARGLVAVEARKGTSNLYRLPRTLDTEDRFTRVSRKVLYDPCLSVGARLAYAIVVHYQRQDDACLRTVATMAKVAGVTRKCFSEWLTELRTAGLIEITRHKKDAAGRHATITAGKKSTRPQRTSLRRDKGTKTAPSAATEPLDVTHSSGDHDTCTSGVDVTSGSGVDVTSSSAEYNPRCRNPYRDGTPHPRPSDAAQDDGLPAASGAQHYSAPTGAGVALRAAVSKTNSSRPSRRNGPSTQDRTRTQEPVVRVSLAHVKDEPSCAWCAREFCVRVLGHKTTTRLREDIFVAWQDICFQVLMSFRGWRQTYDEWVTYMSKEPYFRQNRSWLHKNPAKIRDEADCWLCYAEDADDRGKPRPLDRSKTHYREPDEPCRPALKHCVGCFYKGQEEDEFWRVIGQTHLPTCPLRVEDEHILACHCQISYASRVVPDYFS